MLDLANLSWKLIIILIALSIPQHVIHLLYLLCPIIFKKDKETE